MLPCLSELCCGILTASLLVFMSFCLYSSAGFVCHPSLSNVHTRHCCRGHVALHPSPLLDGLEQNFSHSYVWMYVTRPLWLSYSWLFRAKFCSIKTVFLRYVSDGKSVLRLQNKASCRVYLTTVYLVPVFQCNMDGQDREQGKAKPLSNIILLFFCFFFYVRAHSSFGNGDVVWILSWRPWTLCTESLM